ncbi:MAG: class II fumarate hydratase [Clostridia bacterium]|nr:class II fumarate hydratase [Clostridia bacterium]
MDNIRMERDSLGAVEVPSDRLWGAQTERSRRNFPIGSEKMPDEIIKAFAMLKKASARANRALAPSVMTEEKEKAIADACDHILSGELPYEFPLSVWQTGSGTQTNMNVNEVIANRANSVCGNKLLHPNDDVNLSQSSNDTFPSAMNIASVLSVEQNLIPAIDGLISAFLKLEKENEGVIKSGRTHLQDAVPIEFSQEISGWRGMLEKDKKQIIGAVDSLRDLAVGGTAVGTGLNAPEGFGAKACCELTSMTGTLFRESDNKFRSLTSADGLVFAHGAIKALAADMMKIANDIRWLASGPRCGLAEITIPANEPGSSIMPGKVNPTQCEAMTMIAVQVTGNDAAIGFAASQGNFELNVFLPVMAYNFLQSVELLSDGIGSFTTRCVSGIKADKAKMRDNLERSLMLVTLLNPYIGYDKSAEVAKKAAAEGISLKQSCVELGYMTPEEFDKAFRPEECI